MRDGRATPGQSPSWPWWARSPRRRSGLALGLPPLVAASFVALALVAAGVAWLAPSMASDWLPWILLAATLATALFVAFPDRQLRAAQLTLLAGIAVAGVLLPAVQVLVFAALAIAVEAALLLAAGGTVSGSPSSIALTVAGLGLSVAVAIAAALGARGTRLALGDQLGSDVRAREAEVRSEENAAAFRLLATCSSDLVFLVGLDGRVLYASPSVERLFGASLPAIQGRSFTDRILEADRALALQMAERAMGGGAARGTLRLVLLDGKVRAYDAAFDASTSGDVRVVAIAARDVTEQLRLAEQLQQSQKLEAVGRLARGVAHDFANLLTVVQSGTTLARESLPPGHAAHADLADVSAAADRGVALARQLLAFTRPEGQGPQRAEVGLVLGQLARFIPRLMGAGIRVRISEEVKVGEVPVSATQLEQIILNLAINARDAMPRGGWIRIEARRRELREGEARALAPGPHVEIVVRDEGCGMSEEVRSHLFEPYFTTKGPGRGSGLGLATCLGIVERGGGTIEVESEAGKGSTFRVLLPVASSLEVAAPAPATALSAARRSRILIVDHDPALVALLSRLLAAPPARGLHRRIGHGGAPAGRLVPGRGRRGGHGTRPGRGPRRGHHGRGPEDEPPGARGARDRRGAGPGRRRAPPRGRRGTGPEAGHRGGPRRGGGAGGEPGAGPARAGTGLERGGLLLRHAVERPEPPDQVERVDRPRRAGRRKSSPRIPSAYRSARSLNVGTRTAAFPT